RVGCESGDSLDAAGGMGGGSRLELGRLRRAGQGQRAAGDSKGTRCARHPALRLSCGQDRARQEKAEASARHRPSRALRPAVRVVVGKVKQGARASTGFGLRGDTWEGDGMASDVGKMHFRRMDEGTDADFAVLARVHEENVRNLPDLLIGLLTKLKADAAYPVDRLQHSLQAATRALRDGRDEEYVVCALLHDIGESLGPFNHGEV